MCHGQLIKDIPYLEKDAEAYLFVFVDFDLSAPVDLIIFLFFLFMLYCMLKPQTKLYHQKCTKVIG